MTTYQDSTTNDITEPMLFQFTLDNAVRGACTCGQCLDAPNKPEEKQPGGHTVDLTFFKVAARDPDLGPELKRLVEAEFPKYLDGQEHNYIEVGGDVGDQGIALMLIGLGDVLGVWKALSPAILIPDMPPELQQQLAGSGMVALKAGAPDAF